MCGNRNGKKEDDLMFGNGTFIDLKKVGTELSALKTPENYAQHWQ